METAEEVKSGFTVREATAEDVLPVMNINRICLPENYSYGFFESILRSYPRSFLIAEVDGRIAGYIMCRVERVFSRFERFRIRRAGHIISIAVLPEYRRRGIGRTLLLKALENLREHYECSEAFLEVRVSNHEAIKLYESIGFTKIEVLKRYYMDGEDAYLMAKKL